MNPYETTVEASDDTYKRKHKSHTAQSISRVQYVGRIDCSCLVCALNSSAHSTERIRLDAKDRTHRDLALKKPKRELLTFSK